MWQLIGIWLAKAGQKPCSCGPVKQPCLDDLSKAAAAPSGRLGVAAWGGHDLAMASAGRLVVAALVGPLMDMFRLLSRSVDLRLSSL